MKIIDYFYYERKSSLAAIKLILFTFNKDEVHECTVHTVVCQKAPLRLKDNIELKPIALAD